MLDGSARSQPSASCNETPPCQTTGKHHLVPLETQTAGGLREHKDGGLLDRKALALSLKSQRGRGAAHIARQVGAVI